MKYYILRDHGSEGYTIDDRKYVNINDAVKDAIKGNYCNAFLIIQIIDWEANERFGKKDKPCEKCGSESAENWEADSLDEHTNND